MGASRKPAPEAEHMAPEELAARLRDLASCGGPAGPLLDLAEVWETSTTANVLGDLSVALALALADLAAQVEAGLGVAPADPRAAAGGGAP